VISGECDGRFARVREVFAESFADKLALGAAVAVTIDGRAVVDLWGGVADRTRPWERDTLVNVFSTTKGFTAMCAHRLADQGLLELDAPVSRYWPSLGHGITVAMLLDHSAGLPAVRTPLPPEALFDWDAMTNALAAETPWWEPGTAHGYHAVTFGWLVGEVIRRVSGKSVGEYFRELAGDLDIHIGFGPELDARCAELRTGPRPNTPEPTLFERIMMAPESMTARAFANPPSLLMPGTVASRAYRAAEIPATNGHATARAIAALYGTIDRVLSREAIQRCGTERRFGRDLVLDVTTRFSLGFMLSQPGDMFGPNDSAFGHPGMGGSVGFFDPVARVGFGYTMNRMGTSTILDPRPEALIDALYQSL
jgi:CubicO group peptidase (beta-lactamase class C family)